MRLGVVGVKGNSTNSELRVILPKKPKRVTIDYWRDVLEAM